MEEWFFNWKKIVDSFWKLISFVLDVTSTLFKIVFHVVVHWKKWIGIANVLSGTNKYKLHVISPSW